MYVKIFSQVIINQHKSRFDQNTKPPKFRGLLINRRLRSGSF